MNYEEHKKEILKVASEVYPLDGQIYQRLEFTLPDEQWKKIKEIKTVMKDGTEEVLFTK